MAKLADVTAEFRIIFKLLAVSLVIGTMLFVLFKGGEIFKNVFFPTPPPPPEERFGKLPRIQFPPNNDSNSTYNINTITGVLPATGNLPGQLPDRINVYKVKRKEPSLVALQDVRDHLSPIGFTENETKINESVFQWSNPEGRTIQYNILTDNFRILSNYAVEPTNTLDANFGSKESVFEQTKNFLTNIGEDTSDIEIAKSKVSYFTLAGGELVKSDSRNNAQFVVLDIMQKNIDNYSIYYPNLDTSTMHFVYKTKGSDPKIVEAKFIHFLPDSRDVSSYPIKTASQAFDDLKKGDALILNGTNSNTIDITDVSLGYYAGENNQLYLLPVFIFSGKGFAAYVQAIPSSSIGN